MSNIYLQLHSLWFSGQSYNRKDVISIVFPGVDVSVDLLYYIWCLMADVGSIVYRLSVIVIYLFTPLGFLIVIGLIKDYLKPIPINTADKTRKEMTANVCVYSAFLIVATINIVYHYQLVNAFRIK